MNSCVTLSTDFSVHSPELNLVRRFLSKEWTNDILLNDLFHSSHQFVFFELASFVSYYHSLYPQGSAHLLLCDMYNRFDKKMLVAKINGHWFIAPNNGVLSLIRPLSQWEYVGIFSLMNDEYFPIIQELGRGISLLLLEGNYHQFSPIDRAECVQYQLQMPLIKSSTIQGSVLYIDGFGNAVSNITKHLFDELGKGRNFNLSIGHSRENINSLSPYYGSVDRGAALARFNYVALLEIAINQGNAARLLGLKSVHDRNPINLYSSTIHVEFDKEMP